MAAMERVKGQQLHLQRVLKKELGELEHDYRVQEAKRQREIRSLGVDLTRLQRYTKDVDEVFTDDTPRLLARRASLPALNSPRPLTSPAVPAASRQRRLSVVTPPSRSRLELLKASISNSPSPRLSYSPTQIDLKATTSGKNSPRRASTCSDGGDDKGGSLSVRRRSQENQSTISEHFSTLASGMTHDDNRRGSATAVKVMSSHTQPTRRGSKGSVDGQSKGSDSKTPVKNGVRRSSLDGGSKTGSENGKSSFQPHTNGKPTRRGSKTSEPEVSHNETKVYVHRDGQEPYLVSNDASCPSVGAALDESNMSSMFEGKPSRRASEPALGGHFLRFLQAKASNEETSEVRTHHALTPAEDELRKSIAKDLPSQIVAEEDEDRYNEENGADVACTNMTGGEKAPEKKAEAKSEVKPRKKSDPSARKGQELNSKSDKVKESGTSTKTNTRVSIQENGTSERKQSMKAEKAATVKSSKLQQRRKSDGDVLRFARIWKLQAQNGRHAFRETREEPVNESQGDSTKLSIWDAVRKCRYIRGYNPPEMNEPEDLNEFVFGHPTPDTVIPTK